MRRGRFARDLHDEPSYRLGVAIGQLKDVLNYMDAVRTDSGEEVTRMKAMVKREVERTLRDIDR